MIRGTISANKPLDYKSNFYPIRFRGLADACLFKSAAYISHFSECTVYEKLIKYQCCRCFTLPGFKILETSSVPYSCQFTRIHTYLLFDNTPVCAAILMQRCNSIEISTFLMLAINIEDIFTDTLY